MRLATLRQGGRRAVVEDDAAYLLPHLGRSSWSSSGLERALEVGADAVRGDPIPFAEVDLLLPYKPPSIRDFVTFESHVEGVRRSIDDATGVPEAWYDAPHFYFTNPHALYGPGEADPAAGHLPGARLRDGGRRRGRRDCRLALTEDEAEAAIFGYTIVNDWSARDLQSREMQIGLGPAKGKDFATSIGPWIVTADELDRHNADGFLDLDCKVYVNGELIGHDRLSSMNWTFAQMIAYAARDSVVLAGDLLASGTTGGGGCLAELWGRNGAQTPPPLEPGDVVRG